MRTLSLRKTISGRGTLVENMTMTGAMIGPKSIRTYLLKINLARIFPSNPSPTSSLTPLEKKVSAGKIMGPAKIECKFS
jgi:hypothetical protein